MKNFTFRLTIAGIFLIMLFQPSKVFEGASSGLLLWFQIVLPTLLPFIFIRDFSKIKRRLSSYELNRTIVIPFF